MPLKTSVDDAAGRILAVMLLAMVIVLGPLAKPSAEAKRVQVEEEDLAGAWVGSTGDDLELVRLELSAEGGGKLGYVFLDSQPCVLEVRGWALEGAKLHVKLERLRSCAEERSFEVLVLGSSLKLTMRGEDWTREAHLAKEKPRVERWSRLVRAMQEGPLHVVAPLPTRVARTCAEVSQLALGGSKLSQRGSAGELAAEVWISGEATGEVRITLWRDSNGEVKAEVAQPSPESGAVCEQLRDLYLQDLSLSARAAAQKVDIAVQVFSESEKPELRDLLEEAEQLQFSAALSTGLFIPRRSVRLELRRGMEALWVEFQEPEPSSQGVTFTKPPLTTQPEASSWVTQLLRVLQEESSRPDG